jgi:hypothetical protein
MACSYDGTKAIAAKFGGNVWTSSDSGTTWIERTGATSPGSGGWEGTFFMSPDGVNIVVARNSGSYIYTTCDSGVTWRASNTIAPLAPQLSLTASTSTSLTVAWIGAAGAMSYTYAISPSAGTYVPSLTSDVASTGRGTVVFSGLTASTSYTITITAVNTWGSLASSGLVVSTTA